MQRLQNTILQDKEGSAEMRCAHRLFATIMAVLLSLSFVGCNNSDSSNAKSSSAKEAEAKQEIDAYFSDSRVKSFETLYEGYLKEANDLLDSRDADKFAYYCAEFLKANRELEKVTPPIECATIHTLYKKLCDELSYVAGGTVTFLSANDTSALYQAQEYLDAVSETHDLIGKEKMRLTRTAQ